MPGPDDRRHVSILAIPEATAGTLSGVYDALTSLDLLAGTDGSVPKISPFSVDIVGATRAPVRLASGFELPVHRAIGEVGRTDILIVPSLMVPGGNWKRGRYAETVAWIRAVSEHRSTLCSACSGLFLLAETGLFDGQTATIHWAYAEGFRRSFPNVALRPEQALVVSGDRGQYVSSGASTSWHDLVLYLIAKHAGVPAALSVTRFFALQWHQDGLAPYVVFNPPTDHGDAIVEDCQRWLAGHFSIAAPVEEMVRRSGLAERSFKRRFTNATGLAPIAYVQRLRIEEAKRRLECTGAPVDEIAWQVGYEDPAFFRRLFKRLTGLSPGAYRKTFRVPSYETSGGAR